MAAALSAQGVDARQGCEQAMHRYYRCVDEGRASESLPLFTDDAVLAPGPRRIEGREAIAEALATRQAQADRVTVHQLTNFDLELTGDGEATGHGILGYFSGTAGALEPTPMLGRYTARFARSSDGAWQIAELIVSEVA